MIKFKKSIGLVAACLLLSSNVNAISNNIQEDLMSQVCDDFAYSAMENADNAGHSIETVTNLMNAAYAICEMAMQ